MRSASDLSTPKHPPPKSHIGGREGADDGTDELCGSSLKQVGGPVEDETELVRDTIGDDQIRNGRHHMDGGGVHEVQSPWVIGFGESIVIRQSVCFVDQGLVSSWCSAQKTRNIISPFETLWDFWGPGLR